MNYFMIFSMGKNCGRFERGYTIKFKSLNLALETLFVFVSNSFGMSSLTNIQRSTLEFDFLRNFGWVWTLFVVVKNFATTFDYIFKKIFWPEVSSSVDCWRCLRAGCSSKLTDSIMVWQGVRIRNIELWKI